MPTKYGLFSEPEFLGPGGQTTTSAHVDSRGNGTSFKVPAPKAGKGNDATFKQFISLYAGVPYGGNWKYKSTASSNKAKVTPFKPASPMKRSAGAGDFCGTFSGKVKYEPSPEPLKKKGAVKHQPRQILTRPGKKGGLGHNRVTLSQLFAGAGGVAGEYSYIPDPLSALEASRSAERNKSRQLRVTERPFKPTNPCKKGIYGVPGTNIAGKPVGSVGEYVYTPIANENRPNTLQKKIERPFKPNNPPSAWKYATIGEPFKYVEHASSHDRLTRQMVVNSKQEETRQRLGAPDWKPGSAAFKQVASPSIISHHLNY